MTVEKDSMIAVMGLGKMGGDWVVTLLEGGYRVVGFDVSDGCRSHCQDSVKKGLQWVGKKRHGDDEGFAQSALERFEVVDNEAAFVAQARAAQIFLECIYEDLSLKCEMLARVVPQLKDDTLLWTNTSSLSIQTMAIASTRPRKFVGTHGMNPVYQMPAVEVVQHDSVDESSVHATVELLKGLGKDPFVASDVSGFWVNKHLVPFMLEAMRALERGEITVEDGDIGLKGSLGHPQGVFRLADFIGADTMYRVAMAMYLQTQDPRLYPPALLVKMFKKNQLGVKTGSGFYQWDGFRCKGQNDFTDWIITSSDTVL